MDFELYCRNTMVDETNKYIRHGGSVAKMAADTGLSSSTVRKLANGGTALPRLHTVVAVLEFFGYTLTATRLDKDLVLNEQRHTHEYVQKALPH